MSLLAIQTPLRSSCPAAPLALPWRVVYALNFPTGEPIITHLNYYAKSSAAALTLFHQEMNRARSVACLRCSVHVVRIEPTGVLND